MPTLPHVNSCCFFFSTELGSKIIALFLLISGIIESISAILYLISSLGHKHQSTGDAAVQVIFSLLLTFIGLYLTIGVFKRNMRYVKNWLFIAFIYIIILVLGVLIQIVRGDTVILGQIVNILIVLYCIVVINSFYEDNVSSQPATY